MRHEYIERDWELLQVAGKLLCKSSIVDVDVQSYPRQLLIGRARK